MYFNPDLAPRAIGLMTLVRAGRNAASLHLRAAVLAPSGPGHLQPTAHRTVVGDMQRPGLRSPCDPKLAASGILNERHGAVRAGGAKLRSFVPTLPRAD